MKLRVKHQKITANHKNQTSRVNGFSVFSGRQDARIWAQCNCSFDRHLSCLAPVFCPFPSCIPLRVHSKGAAAVTDGSDGMAEAFIVHRNGGQ